MNAKPSYVDIDLIREKYKHLVHDVEEVVGEWVFHIDRCPVTLKIKVVKTTAGPHPAMYMGIANYAIRSPEQAGAYLSLTFNDTVQEALEDALKGFLMWYNPERAEEIEYVPNEEY